MDGRRNTFTDWSDEETDGEIDDQDVNKILIVTQTPPYLKKHPGGDRTGHHTSRAKLTSELAKVINDGLFYYEQDLWDDKYEPEYATIKVSFHHKSQTWTKFECVSVFGSKWRSHGFHVASLDYWRCFCPKQIAGRGILLQLERFLDLKTLNRRFVLLLSLLAIVALWSSLWEVHMLTSTHPAASRSFL